MNNQTTILLLTAAYRWDGLYRIAQSIYEAACLNPTVKLHWIICKDHHRGSGDIESAIWYCNEHNMLYSVIDAGKSNEDIDWTQPRPGNFGGDMYNEPLMQVMNTYYPNEDPWVYILDDDNLLHPMLPDAVIKSELVSNGRRCIWLTKMRSTGVIDEADRDLANGVFTKHDGSWVIPMIFSPDPSQMVIKHSLIKERGYYHPYSTYDYTWMIPLTQECEHEVIYYHEIFPWNCNKVTAYWNGLRHPHQLAEDIKALENKELTATHFYLETPDPNKEPHIYPVSPKLARVIMEMIRQEYLENRVKGI